jgi:hypothetical protein
MECSINAENNQIIVDVEMFLVQTKSYMQTMHFQEELKC